MTRVVLVDDHAMVRAGVRAALEPSGIEVCAESDGSAIAEVLAQAAPDVVLIDVALGPLDGIEVVRRTRANGTTARFIVLSMFEDQATIRAAAQAGAHAYLVKDCPLTTLVETVRAVAMGADCLSSLRGSPNGHDSRSARSEDSRSALSGRETEVLQLIASGASTAQVAEQLYVSTKTVKNHLSAVYEKLGVTSRTQAVAAGIRLGLVTFYGSSRNRPIDLLADVRSKTTTP